MNNSQQESDLYNYFDKQVNNRSSQEDVFNQSQTSDNISVDENSDHDRNTKCCKII